MKVYLCGITQNEKENIDGLTKDVYEHFDGLIFVDGGSTDGTRELLEERKGGGLITTRKWTNDHDWQMNEFLRQGPLELGDWFVTIDSMERLAPKFTSDIREFIEKCRASQIRSIYKRGKGLMWEFFDDQYFLGSPHWGLQNARPKAIEISNFEDYKDESQYCYNVRDDQREDDHFVDHFVKYYYVYGRSNHLLLGREDDREGFQEHEENRQLFRFYCKHELNLDFTVEALKEHLSKDDWKNDDFFVRKNVGISKIFNAGPSFEIRR